MKPVTGSGRERITWKLKECPRCHGDVYIDHDYYDWFMECLQCGYTASLNSVPERVPEEPAVMPAKWKREKRVRRQGGVLPQPA